MGLSKNYSSHPLVSQTGYGPGVRSYGHPNMSTLKSPFCRISNKIEMQKRPYSRCDFITDHWHFSAPKDTRFCTWQNFDKKSQFA